MANKNSQSEVVSLDINNDFSIKNYDNAPLSFTQNYEFNSNTNIVSISELRGNYDFDLITPSIERKNKIRKEVNSRITALQENLSNYLITSGEDFSQKWTSITYIPSKIIEILEDSILLECYNLDNRKIEIRKFDRSFLGKNISIGENYLLKIYKALAVIKFEIEIDKNNSFSSCTSNIKANAKKVNWGGLKK